MMIISKIIVINNLLFTFILGIKFYCKKLLIFLLFKLIYTIHYVDTYLS